jgi:hypothetical protein
MIRVVNLQTVKEWVWSSCTFPEEQNASSEICNAHFAGTWGTFVPATAAKLGKQVHSLSNLIIE